MKEAGVAGLIERFADLKSDHRMDRCWLAGSIGDALHTMLCAAGYNLRWLMRAVARLGLKGFFALIALILWFSIPISHNPNAVCQRRAVG